MQLLITGSRKFHDYEAFKSALESHFSNIELLLHGGAIGVDQLAQRYAEESSIPVRVIRPDYDKWPAKIAPLKRNSELVQLADATFAVYWGTRKGGTLDTANKTLAAGKPLTELVNGMIIQTQPPLTLF